MSQQSVVLPQIVAAMGRDPRVALAQQAMAQAGTGNRVVGAYDGLAKVLQGAMGGMAARKAEDKYLGQQSEYMDDFKKQLATVLGGGTAGPAGTPPAPPGNMPVPVPGGAPNLPPPPPPAGPPPAPAQGLPGGPQPDPLAPLPDGPPAAPPMPPQAAPPPNVPSIAPPPSAPMAGPGQLNPGMPGMPGVPDAPDSVRKKLGMALMGGGNAYSFNQGLEYLDAGMQEDAQNARETRGYRFDLDKTKYGAEIGDYFGARGDARTAEYGRQRDERQFVFDEAKARADFDRQWELQQHQNTFTSSENDKDRYWGMYKWIGENTGTMPDISDIENIDDDAVFEALILQESGGRPGIAGQPTEYGTAWGASQMLDGTAQQMAAKLGVPWNAAMMRDKSPQGLEYQKTLGRAYFEEGMEKYGGDVSKALMYYHGGPDESKWGPKTRAYVGQVLNRLPAAMKNSGAPSGSIPGLIKAALASKPSPQGNTLFGVTPVNKGKAVAPGYRKELESGVSSLETILDLSNLFDKKHFGMLTDTTGRMRNWVGEHVGHGVGADTDTVNFWKQYDSMNNVVRNELFGAALTAQEQKLWDRSVINTGTAPDVAAKNLDQQVKLLRRAMERKARSAAVSYNSAEVYELAGGDYMRDRVNSYSPLSKQGEGKPKASAKAPEEISLGNQTFINDGKGWKVKGGVQAPKKQKANPRVATVSPTMAGLVFGRQPGVVDWRKYNQPDTLRR